MKYAIELRRDARPTYRIVIDGTLGQARAILSALIRPSVPIPVTPKWGKHRLFRRCYQKGGQLKIVVA